MAWLSVSSSLAEDPENISIEKTIFRHVLQPSDVAIAPEP